MTNNDNLIKIYVQKVPEVSSVKRLQTELDDVKTDVERLDTSVSNLQSTSGHILDASISNLQTQIDSIKSSISTNINSSVNSLTDKVTEVTSAVKTLKKDTSTAIDRLNSKIDDYDVELHNHIAKDDDIDASIINIKNDVKDLNSRVDYVRSFESKYDASLAQLTDDFNQFDDVVSKALTQIDNDYKT